MRTSLNRIALLLVLLAAALARPGAARASSTFELTWHLLENRQHPNWNCQISGHYATYVGGVGSNPTDGESDVFEVNGSGIPLYFQPQSFQWHPDLIETWSYRAAFPSSRLRAGANTFWWSGGLDLDAFDHRDWMHCVTESEIVLDSPTIGPRLLFYENYDGSLGPSYDNWSSVSWQYARQQSLAAREQYKDITFSIEEVRGQDVADAYQDLRDLLEEHRDDLLARAGEADAVAAELEKLDQLFDELDRLAREPIDEITPQAVQSIITNYAGCLPDHIVEQLVDFVEALQESFDSLRDELDDRILDLRDEFGDRWEPPQGFDPHDPSTWEDVLNELEIPEVPPPHDPTSDTPPVDPYDRYAQEIIDRLNDTIYGGAVQERAEFLNIVRGWREAQQVLRASLQARAGIDPDEWARFVAAEHRVALFIDNYLDPNGWFRDTPIPQRVRDLLDFVIVLHHKRQADALKLSLNQWRGNLTRNQRAILDTLLAIEEAIAAIRARNEQQQASPGIFDRLLDGVVAVVRNAPIIGDVADVCELVTGYENCNPNGRKLSLSERLLSGAGIIIGSGAAWRAAADGLGGAAAGVLRLAGKQADDWRDFKTAGSRARRATDTGTSLSEETMARLAFDPDSKAYTKGSVEEVRTILAAREAGFVGKVERAPQGFGDFITATRHIDVKAPQKGWMTNASPNKVSSRVGALVADPKLVIFIDPRNISSSDLQAEIAVFTSRGVAPSRFKTVPADKHHDILVGDRVF